MGKLEANKQQKLTSLLNTAFNLFTTQGYEDFYCGNFSESRYC